MRIPDRTPAAPATAVTGPRSGSSPSAGARAAGASINRGFPSNAALSSKPSMRMQAITGTYVLANMRSYVKGGLPASYAQPDGEPGHRDREHAPGPRGPAGRALVRGGGAHPRRLRSDRRARPGRDRSTVPRRAEPPAPPAVHAAAHEGLERDGVRARRVRLR